jgi:hypothetical protein
MTCKDCKNYDNCRILTIAIEDWDEDEEYESTGDMVQDIEERLPVLCGEFIKIPQ